MSPSSRCRRSSSTSRRSGYIDANFDLSEKAFILEYIRKLVEMRVDEQKITDANMRLELIDRQTTHFDEFFEAVDNSIKRLFDEVAPSTETLERFVYSKLKLSCFEIFKSFDEANQKTLLDVIEELIQADGVVHPAEEKFRDELRALLDKQAPLPPPPPEHRRTKTGTLIMGAVSMPDDLPEMADLAQTPPLELGPPQLVTAEDREPPAPRAPRDPLLAQPRDPRSASVVGLRAHRPDDDRVEHPA